VNRWRVSNALYVRYRTDGLGAQDLNFAGRLPLHREAPVADVYIYRFMRRRGSAGENNLPQRLATLETIKGKGEADMESQLVVDHTEVDGNGFYIGGVGNESHLTDELWTQIRSLERRASSRDSEALLLNESAEGARIYLLRLESRELRKQAQKLQKQRTDFMASELAGRCGNQRPRLPR
jgi:hypothetical protein